MFALSLLVLSANKAGIFDLILKPVDKLKTSRSVLIFWFVLSTFLSAFTLDTTLAIILIPIALLYASKRNISLLETSIAVTWGNTVGSDWTYFGGGDTVIAWSLLEGALKRPLDIFTWGKLFWLPSLLVCLATLSWLILVVIKNKKLDTCIEVRQKLSPKLFIVGALLFLGLTSVFIPNASTYTLVFSIVAGIVSKLTIEDFKKLPFKGIYIWLFAIMFGTMFSNFIQANYTLTISNSMYTLVGILITLLIITLLTNVMTNSAIAAILLPLVLASTFVDKPWLYVLVTKAISLSYLTIFANAGLAVSVSYKALNQKMLFKYGLPIVTLQILIYLAYFYVMRGHIYL